jgi:hypothetical protein
MEMPSSPQPGQVFAPTLYEMILAIFMSAAAVSASSLFARAA